jgi:DnaK suppressor protein
MMLEVTMKSKRQRTKSLRPDELQTVKEGLLQRKRELWQEILEDLEKHTKEEYQDLIQTIKDEGDLALADLREGTIFSLVQVRYRELEQIDYTLSRIDKGQYGQCVDCNRWISRKRLEVMPHALRCPDCQAKSEKMTGSSRSPEPFVQDYGYTESMLEEYEDSPSGEEST